MVWFGCGWRQGPTLLERQGEQRKRQKRSKKNVKKTTIKNERPKGKQKHTRKRRKIGKKKPNVERPPSTPRPPSLSKPTWGKSGICLDLSNAFGVRGCPRELVQPEELGVLAAKGTQSDPLHLLAQLHSGHHGGRVLCRGKQQTKKSADSATKSNGKSSQVGEQCDWKSSAALRNTWVSMQHNRRLRRLQDIQMPNGIFEKNGNQRVVKRKTVSRQIRHPDGGSEN